METRIIYEDVSINAKEESTPSVNEAQAFSDIQRFKLDTATTTTYATLENNAWVLDGSLTVMDEPTDISWWTQSLSDADGIFDVAPTLEITFSGYQTTVGLSLEFDRAFPQLVVVQWYQNSTLLDTKEFMPNSVKYFCSNVVSDFNKLVISFNSMSEPYRFLKMVNIIYGISRTFGSNELRSVTLFEQISLTSEQIPIDTLDFTIVNQDNVAYSWQQQQQLKLYKDNDFVGLFFLDKTERATQNVWKIQTQDYLGVLDNMMFAGGTYTNQTVSNIVQAIMGNIPYEVDPTIGAKTLSGTLETCTCREALLQVAFATSSLVDTKRSDKVKIFPMDNTLKRTVTAENIYDGVSFNTESDVTEVRLTLNNDTTISKRNPILPSNALDNILEFSGVFCDSSNGQAILDNLYDYYVTNGNSSTDMKYIAESDMVGDKIEYETEYLGNRLGRIVEMRYTFNTNKWVAQAKLKDLV